MMEKVNDTDEDDKVEKTIDHEKMEKDGKPVGEDKVETDVGEDDTTEDGAKDKEEGKTEEDRQPGPGGLLFGTLFKYMEDKEEGEGGKQEAEADDTSQTVDKPAGEVQSVEEEADNN